VSAGSINRDAPALNPKRRSKFIEEDDGSSIQSSGASGFGNGNRMSNGFNYAANADSMRNRWSGASRNGSTNSRWSQSGVDQGSTNSRWSQSGPDQSIWGADLRDAVSPDNPPIGFDRHAWKEYISAIERRREEQVELMRKTLRMSPPTTHFLSFPDGWQFVDK
jgi:hypothetical protein